MRKANWKTHKIRKRPYIPDQKMQAPWGKTTSYGKKLIV